MADARPPTGPKQWDEWVDAELWATRQRGQWRALRPLDGLGPTFLADSGRPVVSFASNDYLGLSSHPEVVEACARAAARWGAGTGSSRLIVGDRPLHHELERELADWKKTEAALVFPSGYQANLAVLTTFAAGAGCTVVSDELNHASIIDGARLSRARIAVYRHRDVDHARALVRAAPGRAVVVSDTVFSMDGDVAPVDALSELCASEGSLLVLDDAHAVFAVPPADSAAACLRVGTLSKMLGSQGGFVSGPAPFVDLLVNRARSFIFTTGLAPVSAAAARAALSVLQGDAGTALLQRLRGHVDAVAPRHPSPIVPLILGSEEAAVRAADQLLSAGLLVPAIRPPTVPPGTSRLRISLSAAHSDSEVDALVRALRPFRP